MNYRINLKTIKDFGLSLDSRKKYVMHYDNHTWSIMGIYDNLEKAVNKGLNQTLDEYYEDLKKYGEEKGFVTDINVWDVIDGINTNLCLNDHNSEEENFIRYCIKKMQNKN